MNIVKLKPKDLEDQAIEVLNFLNEKLGKAEGRGYRAVDTNLDFIKARLKSGITVEDLRAIIALKHREMLKGEFDKKYMRPATLFNKTKCEQYYGELG